MAGVKDYFNGIVELAKAGYKPNDVKDLLELIKTDPELEANSATVLNESTSENKTKPAEAKPNIESDIDAIAEIINRESKGE